MLAEKKEALLRENDRSELLDYLMRRFSDKVVKIAYYHVRDRHMAEDICQEVFLRVYKNLDKFCKDSSYFTWIYRITVNLCRDYRASAYFRRMLPWCEWDAEDISKTDERLLEVAEGGEILSKVMDLPLKYRTVLALYYFEEFTTPEIARILKIRENTVRARLSRGRKMLKKMLAREESIYE
ncbi:MAG TPA: sigma-70 family RNA polymerase sigma factor [Clostridiaceae bacterium]|nr:sigma-70 family RNA polymerase sigma factor [Clostridiaceae bacterium]